MKNKIKSALGEKLNEYNDNMWGSDHNMIFSMNLIWTTGILEGSNLDLFIVSVWWICRAHNKLCPANEDTSLYNGESDACRKAEGECGGS